MKVIVASANPVKINATEIAFKKMFPKDPIEVIGIESESGVPDQPMGEEETRQGAENRVAFIQEKIKDAEYWVGIEGGNEVTRFGMKAYGVIVTKNAHNTGYGKTLEFYLPQKIADLVAGGMETGDADDIVFKRKNSKQKNGSIGLLTNDNITRTSFISDAVIASLIPFVNPNLY
jgi:inosine/xanthosine triphosphatase